MSGATFTVRRRDLAWAVSFLLVLSAIWVARSDVADAGGSPPGTGIAVVYVAVGTNYPDALGVGPGSGADAAPIIILPTNPPIPSSSESELVRLDPRTLIIIGGTSAISDAMETALVTLLPNAVISRIAGNNRYDTNAAFSAATFPIEGWASVVAAAFTGDSPASDAVSLQSNLIQNDTDANMYAQIQLPHGAQILELKAHVYDGSGANDLSVALWRVDSVGGQLQLGSVATFSFAGGNTTLASVAISPGLEIVDNENFGYLLIFTGNATQPTGVRNVMVRYRLGSSNG